MAGEWSASSTRDKPVEPAGAAVPRLDAPDPTAGAADPAPLIQQLQAQQNDFIAAELTHLRELALLNRMSDALALRRTHQQVLEETAREAMALTGSTCAWLIEPDSQGRISTVRDASAAIVAADALPAEVRDLCTRLFADPAAGSVTLPTYDPTAPEGLFLGMPMATAEHLMAVVVVGYTDLTAATSSERQRLLQSLLHQAAIACENAKLFETIGSMIVDVVVAMAQAIESRDPYTGGHVQRVTGYAVEIAQHAGLDEATLSKLRLGGMLHDIGKVAVPDAILRKPGKLDPAEWAVMQSHAAVGHQIIRPIPQLAPVAGIVRHHHERWDGKGYPDRLAGAAIDYLARVTAIADTFDAMTSDRPYRKGLTFAIARAEIAKGSGTQFDPDLAGVLTQVTDGQLRASAQRAEAWCAGNRPVSSRHFLGFLDIDRPKIK
jgi:hypothetical protein